MRKSTERLACEMTQAEKLERAERLASTLRHIDGIETEHKIVCEQYKEAVKTAQAEIDNLSQELRTGETFKDVQVTHEANFDENVMIYARTDTGETIRSRPLNEDEMQQKLPGTEEIPGEESEEKGK